MFVVSLTNNITSLICFEVRSSDIKAHVLIADNVEMRFFIMFSAVFFLKFSALLISVIELLWSVFWFISEDRVMFFNKDLVKVWLICVFTDVVFFFVIVKIDYADLVLCWFNVFNHWRAYFFCWSRLTLCFCRFAKEKWIVFFKIEDVSV